METDEHPEHLSYQQLYFIELCKFRKEWHEVSTLLDRWIGFLNKAQELGQGEIPLPLRDDATIMKAIGKLERLSFDEREREIYEAELKARLDDQEELRTAREKGEKMNAKISLTTCCAKVCRSR